MLEQNFALEKLFSRKDEIADPKLYEKGDRLFRLFQIYGEATWTAGKDDDTSPEQQQQQSEYRLSAGAWQAHDPRGPGQPAWRSAQAIVQPSPPATLPAAGR